LKRWEIITPETICEVELYKYEIILDSNITKIQKAKNKTIEGLDFISIYGLSDHDKP